MISRPKFHKIIDLNLLTGSNQCLILSHLPYWSITSHPLGSMTAKLRVGYIRVSSVAGQKTDRQMAGLEGLGLDRLYEDKVSGSVPMANRPNGKRLLDDVARGIVGEIHFTSVDRAGRSVQDITNVLYGFINAGIQVVIHKEGLRLLDDDGKQNPTAALVLSVMSAIAQIERTAIRERCVEGLAVARAKGRLVGRKKGTTESTDKFLSKPKSQRVARLFREGHNISRTAAMAGVSYVTAMKVKKLMAA